MCILSHVQLQLTPHLVCNLLDEFRTRVKVLVDAVAKAKELLFLVFNTFQKRRNFVRAANAHEHADDSFVGASVQRTIQRANRACTARSRHVLVGNDRKLKTFAILCGGQYATTATTAPCVQQCKVCCELDQSPFEDLESRSITY